MNFQINTIGYVFWGEREAKKTRRGGRAVAFRNQGQAA